MAKTMKKIIYSWRGVVLDGGYFNKNWGAVFFCICMFVCMDVRMGVPVSECGDQKTTSGITPHEPFIHLVLLDTSFADLKLTSLGD